jgi:hypothetical protein
MNGTWWKTHKCVVRPGYNRISQEGERCDVFFVALKGKKYSFWYFDFKYQNHEQGFS